eukprot:gnl/MRDRNA2_/MRDRNA2_145400_c0_seq1.p1 gnl/MRDRNA2_/MRDRNA2_145400_c0~~gnl/MRDRNA2_/MRDRNA2_145400_c0_seq1.p1  ORF type:complete len:438 (-),score=68.00 gnl/MRDRNA2_/MRDRNA2_145400_c0_seq1:92-1405(-)
MRSTVYRFLALLILTRADTDSKNIRDVGVNLNAEWLELSNWITENGGLVDSNVRESMTVHQGFSIRGMVSNTALESGRAVLHVPKKLWLTLENFPDINNVQLDKVPQCGAPLKDYHLHPIKLAGALARERKKGNASLYHSYISKLPTLDDFRSFHPRLIDVDAQKDFAGLPIIEFTLKLQQMDVQVRNCFLSWTTVPNSPVAGISAEEQYLALMQYRTRAFSSGGVSFMVPGADFFNTDGPAKYNTLWKAKDGVFTVMLDMTPGGVQPNVELYDEYCAACDNAIMMSIWGLYLEDNKNPLKTSADCNAKVDPSAPHKHGSFKSLRDAAEAMLDLKDVDAAREAGRTAPRCREELLSLEQGPLRCSFARLAFEHCKMEWGYLGSRVPEYALVQHPPDASLMADLISRSYIHAVHPALLSPSHSPYKNLRKSQRLSTNQ